MPRSRRQLRFSLAHRDGWTCHWCARALRETPDKADPARATLDHLRAKSLGGTYAKENLVLACSACNGARGAAPGPHVPPPMHPAPCSPRRSPIRDACVVCGARTAGPSLHCVRCAA